MTADEIFEALLIKRGIADRERFLNPLYEHAHDPMLLPDMAAAVKRVVKAHKAGETVAIYGDYDIDGLTASTILTDAFNAFGIKSFVFIPDRFKDGYGLAKRAIDEIHEQGATLVVTVDCGSRSLEEVEHANSLGIDVVVTDHHQVGEELPKAVAVVNPKRADSKYPFSDLAGCGVAFKLVRALQTKLEGLPEGQEKWLLDLVALGTVCDVVSLTDENRVFVTWGLQVLRRTRRPGLRALAAVSKTELGDIDTQALGYRFGPRLNAAGRLETAQAGLELLQATDSREAMRLAAALDDLNYERRREQARITEEALAQAAQYADDPVLVLSDPGWSHGIVGIVASKLVDDLGKPVFMLQELETTAKGSARSFGDFHLAQALDVVRPLLKTGGGHAFAAGCSMALSDVPKFRQALNDHYRSLKFAEQVRVTRCDLELDDLSGLTEELLALVDRLEPFGQGNGQPLFTVKNLLIDDFKAVGGDATHAKVRLRDSLGNRGEGIGFGLAEALKDLKGDCCLDLHVERNVFNGRTTLQYRVTRLHPA